MTEVTVKCQPASLPSRPHKKLSSLPKRVAVTTGVSAEARALANEVAKQLEDAGCIVVQVRFDGDLEGAVVGSDAVVNVAGLDSACSSSVASLVKAAVAAKVSRIVTAACTDIMYDGKDIKGGSEATPVGDDGAAVGAAERIVLETKGLQACALRIAPLYGGQSLEVRLAQKAREGKVVQPGDGSNVTDFCFVGNAAYALILALDDLGRGSSSVTSGKVYIITDGEPVPRWDFLSRLLSGIGYSAPTASPWPVFLLLFFARILDIFASIVGAESKKTRELQFGTAYMYFNIEAARRDLGYDPLWTLDGAIDVTIQKSVRNADIRNPRAKVIYIGPFSQEEVADHCTEDDAWIIVDRKVYNITGYNLEHPGGDAILRHLGQDNSEKMRGLQHPPQAFEILEEHYIGELLG